MNIVHEATRATYGCCHAPVVGGVDPQHQCSTNRAGGNGMANHAPTRNAAVPNARGVHAMESARGASAARRQPATKPPGRAAEDAMAEQLAGAGWVVQTYGEWLRTAIMTGALSGDVVREFPWGLTLAPARRFRSDFAIPAKGLLVEIDGRVHHVVAKQGRVDVLRAQLAQQAGYRILRLLPDQIATGKALALVRAAVKGGVS